MEPDITGCASSNLTPSDKRNINTAFRSLLVIIALAIFGGGAYYLSGHPVKPTTSVLGTEVSTTPVISQVSLIINSGDGQPISTSLPYSDSQTAFSLLSTAAQMQSLTVIPKVYEGLGTMVVSIDNHANSSAKSWVYYINGQSATVAADKYQIQPGDVIEWKYVPPQF